MKEEIKNLKANNQISKILVYLSNNIMVLIDVSKKLHFPSYYKLF